MFGFGKSKSSSIDSKTNGRIIAAFKRIEYLENNVTQMISNEKENVERIVVPERVVAQLAKQNGILVSAKAPTAKTRKAATTAPVLVPALGR